MTSQMMGKRHNRPSPKKNHSACPMGIGITFSPRHLFDFAYLIKLALHTLKQTAKLLSSSSFMEKTDEDIVAYGP